jgi:anion-transporting  ArsA/GET3 family ATPase
LNLKELLSQHRLLTFVGTGGVGKTSLSILSAVAAARDGKKVAAITVDPSRRLSEVMGIGEEKAMPIRLSWPQWSGHLDVYYVDTEETFAAFVRKNMDSAFYARLSQNKIYQQISKNLRETHNFAALYQMIQVIDDPQYDLVILDTPPCHQVVDFFEAPQRLQSFFSAQLFPGTAGSWLGWIKDQGVRAAEMVLQAVVGSEFVEEMDGFLRGVSGLKKEIASVSEAFTQALGESSSHIVLIFSSAEDKVLEAQYLGSQIEKNNFRIGSYVINRAFIPGLGDVSNNLSQISGQEKELYQDFVEQKGRAQSILQNLALKKNDPQLSFSLLPDLSHSLESREQVLAFVSEMEKYWLEVKTNV